MAQSHVDELKILCRLCGQKLSKSHNIEHKYQYDIKLSLNIDIDEDQPSTHPPYMCTCCRLKLVRWRKQKNKSKKSQSININVRNWFPHDDACKICPDTPPPSVTPAQAARQMANQFGLVSWDDKGASVFVKTARNGGGVCVERSLVINADNTWEGSIYGQRLGSTVFPDVSQCLQTAADACKLITELFGRKLCKGNVGYDDIIDNKTTFKGVRGEITGLVMDATFVPNNLNKKTVRHVKCQLFIDSSSNTCPTCCIYRATLNAMRSNRNKQKQSSSDTVHSCTRNDYLKNDQVKDKFNNLRNDNRNLLNQNKGLQEQIRLIHERESVQVSDEQNEFLQEALKHRPTNDAVDSSENEAFRLLYEEQLKASSAKDKRQIRWHPAIIRFSIALYNKSSAAYNLIRNSPFLQLPHQSTIKKYMKFTTTQAGVNPDIMEFIANDINIQNLPDFKKNITLVFDEIKLKSGLIYSKATGKLIGYTDLGPISNELAEFNKRLTGDQAAQPEVATQMLVLMARGIFSSLRLPVAYFPTKNATSHELYHCIWPTVKALAVFDLTVRAFVADGASWNRKFFSGHEAMPPQPGQTIYYTKHRFLRNERMYFICDVPHLVKTARNNFENSGWHLKSRNLRLNNQDIKWTHMLDLWKWDRGENQTSPGFRLMKSVGESHLYLTPSLRMRVSLAAQVLSTTVANCFALRGRPETKSTEHFIRMMDRFFDCLNVKTPYQWIRSNKPVLKPYTDVNDERFKWLLQEFLPFLDGWQQSAMSCPNLTTAEKKKQCLSEQTLEGLRITVMSFVELAKDLLRLPGVEFLCSDKLNQDPLEEWFSLVRGAGGANSNPSAKELGDTQLNLLVAGSNAVASTRGNCRTQKRAINLDDTPLPKKKIKRTHLFS